MYSSNNNLKDCYFIINARLPRYCSKYLVSQFVHDFPSLLIEMIINTNIICRMLWHLKRLDYGMPRHYRLHGYPILSNNSHNGAQSLMHLSLVETAHFSSKRHDCNIKEGIS